MTTHVKALGILYAIFGGLGILAGLGFLLLFGGLASLVSMTDMSGGARIAAPVLGGLGGLIFVIALALSLPALVGGIGLLQFRRWARILMIVISAIEILNFPFGTVLGVYGLWVLLSPQTQALFLPPPGLKA